MNYKMKVTTPSNAAGIARDWQAHGLKVVLAHGCFDLLHAGHIFHLSWAREQGDILLVSITPDLEINKGEGRPLFPEQIRAENVAALEFVSWVTILSTPTPHPLITTLRPDIYVKGGDVEENPTVELLSEMDLVERLGGEMRFSPKKRLYHSTDILEILRKRL